jgi:hypothetical protein
MKLNPPASSSDLETARQIARRLHQSRRRDDRAATSLPSEEAPARPRLRPPPLPARPAPAPAPPPPEPALQDVSVEADAADLSLDVPAAPPWSAPAASEPEPVPLEELAGTDEPSAFAPEESAMPDADIDVDVDESPLSPEEMVGESVVEADASALDQLTEAEASPFGDDLLDAAPAAEEPAPPSWDDIVETCRETARAAGAMLVDPAGQVFSARGDWPAPGPDAIAGKLVAMMAKTLKDAPTRSISAPLAGMHLTAWRVPLREGLVTVAFIGAAPVRAEARPAIDAEILSGIGF